MVETNPSSYRLVPRSVCGVYVCVCFHLPWYVRMYVYGCTCVGVDMLGGVLSHVLYS